MYRFFNLIWFNLAGYYKIYVLFGPDGTKNAAMGQPEYLLFYLHTAYQQGIFTTNLYIIYKLRYVNPSRCKMGSADLPVPAATRQQNSMCRSNAPYSSSVTLRYSRRKLRRGVDVLQRPAKP
jgi:hypothetical protein